MKKTLLFSLVMLLFGALQAAAQTVSVVIGVDNASHVVVKTNYGYGSELQLNDGINQFKLSDTDDSPLQIKAAEGYEIVSVTKNESETITGNNGEYLVRFYSGGVKVDIVTKTSEGTTPSLRDVLFSVSANGADNSSFTVTYQKDGEWVVPEKEYSMWKCPENSVVKVSPVSPYVLNSLTTRSGEAVETTAADGALTFVCAYEKFYYQTLYANMAVDENAIKFSITVDYAPNLSVFLENQREGEWISLLLKDGKNDFICLPENSPLEFFTTEGAEILGITHNGEPAFPTGWGGSNGWVFELENNDAFVVTTLGKEVDVELVVLEGQNYTGLENYYFKNDEGKVYKASGMKDVIKVHAGENITVSPRPGTIMKYIMHSNGGTSNMYDTFRAAAGADGVNPMKVTVCGTRNVSGITINVDEADRVQVLQEGGRGDALELHKGSNNFTPDDIKNALAVSATEGNQIVSVTLNGDAVAANANGIYLINAVEEDWIEITSRKNPVDVAVTFSLNEGAQLKWLKATINGQDIELTSPLTVKSYSVITVAARDGYTLEQLTCADDVQLVKNGTTNVYTITISSADVTAITVNATLTEMTPDDGNAIVVPNGDETLIKYREFSKEQDGTYKFVKVLDNNTVNQVKLGNYVEAYCKDSESYFSFVKANGEDVAFEAGSDNRKAYILIEGRTEIEAEVHTPCQAYTQSTFDDVKHIECGTVYFVIDGKDATSINPVAGQKVTFRPAPAKGYVFSHIEKFYSLTFAADGIRLDGLEYTFTEADVKENYILFKGVFTEDPEVKSYVVRGSTAWLMDANGEIVSGTEGAKGNVIFQDNEGKYVREITGIEGDVVKLFVTVTNEEEQEKYIVDSYCFMKGFPNSKIPGSEYTIKAEDADAEGVIWINAIVKEKNGSGVDDLEVTSAISYDSAAQMLKAQGAIRVYGVSGNVVLSTAETELSVARLPAGVYIAVSENSIIKFVR